MSKQKSIKRVKSILQFVITLGLMTIALTAMSSFAHTNLIHTNVVQAASALPLSNQYKSTIEGAGIPTPPQKEGQQIVIDLVLGVFSYVKVIAGVLGIAMLIFLGYRLVVSSGEDDSLGKIKKGFIYTLVSFVIISMSQDLANIFGVSSSGGTLLSSPIEISNRVKLFNKEVEIFMVFIKYVIGTYAVIMAMKSGVTLVTAGGDDESTKKGRKGLIYSIAGLLMLYVGDIFINKVFYNVDQVYSGINGVHPMINVKTGIEQLVGIINFLMYFIAPAAFVMLIVAAVMYVGSGGQDETMKKAKNIIVATIIGIIIIYGAFAIVSTVLSSQIATLGAMATS